MANEVQHVRVTDEHIQAHVSGPPERSAIALALRSVAGVRPTVKDQAYHIVMGYQSWRKSKALMDWSEQIDDGKSVQPITIVLTRGMNITATAEIAS